MPLGNKEPDDHPPVAPNNQAEQVKVDERSVDKEKETIDNHKENLKKEVESRREKERLDVEVKGNVVQEQQLEKKKLERELEKEREEKLALRQQLEREEKERIEKEVLVRVEKERLEREKREEQEKAKLVQELQKAVGEINERANQVLQVEETQERLAALQRAAEAKITKEAEQGGEGKEGKALKNGGRDLKEQAAAQADPGEEPRPQSSNEKAREQGDTDLKRRRRALGPREAAWPLKDSAESRGVPGLEPLLELGGSDLHAALEQQLLAGAVVHSRQMKQAAGDDDGTK